MRQNRESAFRNKGTSNHFISAINAQHHALARKVSHSKFSNALLKLVRASKNEQIRRSITISPVRKFHGVCQVWPPTSDLFDTRRGFLRWRRTTIVAILRRLRRGAEGGEGEKRPSLSDMQRDWFTSPSAHSPSLPLLAALLQY